jgi:hypothetical protein
MAADATENFRVLSKIHVKTILTDTVGHTKDGTNPHCVKRLLKASTRLWTLHTDVLSLLCTPPTPRTGLNPELQKLNPPQNPTASPTSIFPPSSFSTRASQGCSSSAGEPVL